MRSVKLLLAILLIAMPGRVWAAYEDLTTFTEVDSDSDITVTSSTSTFGTMVRVANSSVYKDYGASYFGNFRHNITVEWTAKSGSFPSAAFYVLSDTAALTIQDGITANAGIFIMYAEPNILRIEEYAADTADTYTSFNQNTLLYLTVERTATTLLCYVYTDAARTTLVDTLSITRQTYSRYLGVTASRDSASSDGSLSGNSRDLDINPSGGNVINDSKWADTVFLP